MTRQDDDHHGDHHFLSEIFLTWNLEILSPVFLRLQHSMVSYSQELQRTQPYYYGYQNIEI
jgi:hypothetical protein